MAGTIYYQKDRKRYCVSFPIPGRKSPLKVTRYNNVFLYDKKLAKKCLAAIQADWERHIEGVAQFRIEKWTKKGWTDVNEFFEEWLLTKKKKKPATYKGYQSYYKCHFRPFFEETAVMLHEIQLDTLTRLMESLKNTRTKKPLAPKMKYNIMNCFHEFMSYAWRCRRIQEMPPFPKKEDYDIQEKIIEWLPEDDQMRVIECMPEYHRPIFLWLKYHYRRLAEACALHKSDYDEINQIFTVRRSISARELVETTKTHKEHYVPCDPDFLPYMKSLLRPAPRKVFNDNVANEKFLREEAKSPFLFINPLARHDGKRYTDESLNKIWKKASEKAGVKILTAYPGTKHSACSQFINEKNGTVDELQMLTDHQRRDSVLKYAKVGVSRKLSIMKKSKLRIVDATKLPQTTKSDEN